MRWFLSYDEAPNKGAGANSHQPGASIDDAVVTAAMSLTLLGQRSFHRWLDFVFDARLEWLSLSLGSLGLSGQSRDGEVVIGVLRFRFFAVEAGVDSGVGVAAGLRPMTGWYASHHAARFVWCDMDSARSPVAALG